MDSKKYSRIGPSLGCHRRVCFTGEIFSLSKNDKFLTLTQSGIEILNVTSILKWLVPRLEIKNYLKLNGTKKWKLWKNPEMELPPGDSSNDLDPEILGEPTEEVELKPGDMLYMPRGLIHCAQSGPDESSIHVTFSVNENNTAAHWLSANFNSMLDMMAEDHLFLR